MVQAGTLRALIIEDDLDFANAIQAAIASIGIKAETTASGAAGLGFAVRNHYDIVILDLKLPDLSGLDVCRDLRRVNPEIGIIIVSAGRELHTRLEGLESGADDYLMKPFDTEELLARIHSLARRLGSAAASREAEDTAEILHGPLTLDPLRRIVTLRRKELALTATEFDLLYHFMRSPGRVFSREELLLSVWGYQYAGYESTVNVHINRLRSKIEPDPAKP